MKPLLKSVLILLFRTRNFSCFFTYLVLFAIVVIPVYSASIDMEAKKLAFKNDDVAYLNFIEDNKKHLDSALSRASSRGKYNIAKALIEKGADVDYKDSGNLTPLHRAAYRKHTKIGKLLIQNGANVNAKGSLTHSWSNEKRTPLHVAANVGDLALVKLLVESGANVNAFDVRKYSPIFLATMDSRTSVVKYLLEKGAKVNFKDRQRGMTPLHKGVHTNKKIAIYLLAYGAKLNVKNKNGRTPLDISYKSIIPILQKASTPNVQALIKAGEREKVIEILSESTT